MLQKGTATEGRKVYILGEKYECSYNNYAPSEDRFLEEEDELQEEDEDDDDF